MKLSKRLLGASVVSFCLLGFGKLLVFGLVGSLKEGTCPR